MGMMPFHCPYCHTRRNVTDQWAGRVIQCPGCARHVEMRAELPDPAGTYRKMTIGFSSVIGVLLGAGVGILIVVIGEQGLIAFSNRLLGAGLGALFGFILGLIAAMENSESSQGAPNLGGYGLNMRFGAFFMAELLHQIFSTIAYGLKVMLGVPLLLALAPALGVAFGIGLQTAFYWHGKPNLDELIGAACGAVFGGLFGGTLAASRFPQRPTKEDG